MYLKVLLIVEPHRISEILVFRHSYTFKILQVGYISTIIFRKILIIIIFCDVLYHKKYIMQIQLIQLHLSQKLIQQYHNYTFFLIDEKEINVEYTLIWNKCSLFMSICFFIRY